MQEDLFFFAGCWRWEDTPHCHVHGWAFLGAKVIWTEEQLFFSCQPLSSLVAGLSTLWPRWTFTRIGSLLWPHFSNLTYFEVFFLFLKKILTLDAFHRTVVFIPYLKALKIDHHLLQVKMTTGIYTSPFYLSSKPMKTRVNGHKSARALSTSGTTFRSWKHVEKEKRTTGPWRVVCWVHNEERVRGSPWP